MAEFTTAGLAPTGGATISAADLAAHEGLVHWVVRQQWGGDLPYADALHEGRLGLWRALCRFDPARGTAFSTYAVPAIARAVWRAVELEQRPLAPGSCLPTANGSDEVVELLHQAQVRATLRQAVAQLPPRLCQVVVAHYGLGGPAPQTFAAIGAALGLTRQRIQQLHVEALLWLGDPAHSQPLRRLLGRHQRGDYQQALARQRHWARRRRHGPHAPRPLATLGASGRGGQRGGGGRGR